MNQTAIQTYLDAIPLASVFVGADRRIVASNEPALTINPNANAQKPFILIFRQPGLSNALENCLKTRAAQRAILHHNDGPHAVRYDVTLSYVEGFGPPGVLLCFTDVTRDKQADLMRRDFVANVSHELRSPLTAILGFIETLQGPAKEDPKAQQRFLALMSNEANRMNRLVAELLSLSKVEETARVRPTEKVEISSLIQSVISNLSFLEKETGGEISFDKPKEKIMLPADSDQLRQVLSNLIENALKYGGPNTSVQITCKNVARDRRLRAPACQIKVRDNGPGIDEVHIARLTERFYRIDSHRSRQMGGTGLGLAIVKHIVNRHRGHLQIASELGQGSEFTVTLPIS